MHLNLHLFPYPSIQTCVLGAQKNRLIETVLLSTHNICFDQVIRKIIFQYALLSGGLITSVSDIITTISRPTVLPANSDSDIMFCLQSYQGLRINRSLVY